MFATKMKPDNIQKYISLMAEIKRRTTVVDNFSKRKTNAVYKATMVESIYLQFRKILELIAMGSLAANKEIFSQFHEKFSTYWNAKYIIKDIEKLNPEFYPFSRLVDRRKLAPNRVREDFSPSLPTPHSRQFTKTAGP